MLLSAAVLFTVACEKDEVSPVTSNETVVVKEKISPNNKVGDGPIYIPQNYRMFWDEINYPTGCVPFKGDCFPVDVVITPGMESNVDGLFVAINSGDQSVIQAAFSNHSVFLIDLMADEMPNTSAEGIINGVIDGSVLVSAVFNTVAEDGNTDQFMIFNYANTGDQLVVMPFTH